MADDQSRFIIQTLVAPDEEPDARVDAVELRFDHYPGTDVEAAVARQHKPVVATGRRERDGGRWNGNESERTSLLRRAAAAAYVDVELDLDPAEVPGRPRRIVSHHTLDGVPPDLDALFQQCLLRGADRVKIAAMPTDPVQAFRLLDLPTSGLGMGPWGGFTRALAPLTYCAAEPVAPGMPTPADLFDLYDVRRLGPRTALYGVAGDPVEHSRSPQLHNPALRRDGVDAVYLRFRVSDLAPFWRAFVEHGGRGLSVTAPLKEQAFQLARAPDADARACGAANTLLHDGRAFNTDLQAMLELVPRGSGDALILGAGGTARTARVALQRLGYTPRVWARRLEQAAAFGIEVAAQPEAAPVVVNTTTLDPPAAPFVLDLRYGPGVDPPRAGVDGLTFLRAQARHQYRLFTGREL